MLSSHPLKRDRFTNDFINVEYKGSNYGQVDERFIGLASIPRLN